MNVSAESPSADFIPVLHEFVDVFLNNLLIISPERDIVFICDLEPNTRLISMAPYYMAPVELKELNS